MQKTPARSPWEEALAADEADRDLPWSTDGRITQNSFAAGMARIAREKNDWAGMPVPLMGERLSIASGYYGSDKQDELNRIFAGPEAVDDGRYVIRNRFWSDRLMSEVVIVQDGDKFHWCRVPGINHFNQDMRTLGCSDAWSLKTEEKALGSLRSLVEHRKFRQYLLAGSFLERSKRSDLTYWFRRLRPTIALSPHTGTVKILAALCLHPVAYYQETWAGAQCPTDDVIAHLMLMRGDEAMFWKRANQHHAIRPEAGL